MNRIHTSVAVLLLIVSAGTSVVAQQSAHYSMERVTVAAVADTASSTHFTTTVVIGQESPAGASSFCNAGFRSSMGFWSILGDLPVPIVLQLGKQAGDPSTIDLIWSGADSSFAVYRSADAATVLNPENLFLEVPVCQATDLVTGTPNLVFYNVVAGPTSAAR